MKKQLILTLTILTLLLNSCSLDVDFDETQGYISVTAKGDNINGNVSNNGHLDLDIIVEDDDGIAHIEIEIPVLKVGLIIDSNSSNNRWKVSQTFSVNEVLDQGVYPIYIILKDKDENKYSRTVTFNVD